MFVQNVKPTQAISKAIASIKAAVENYEALASSSVPSADLDVLDLPLNSVQPITAALQQHPDISRVQVIPYEAGRLHGDAAQFDLSNLGSHQNHPQPSWKTVLPDKADSLYDRSVTALSSSPARETNLVNQLNQLVGVEVAAAYSPTVKSTNWNLDLQTGTLNSSTLRSASLASASTTLTTITVTSAADSGPGSLREAIAAAVAGSTIKFAGSLTGKTIVLKTGQLAITKNLTIDGSGAANLTISGNKVSRIFDISNNLTVTLNNLTIANGKTIGSGGGVNVRDYSKITINNCKFNYNVGGIGGAVRIGYKGSGSVTNSSFTGNNGTTPKSGFSGGAIATNGGGGSLIIRGSQFTNNQGINGGAIYSLLGPLTVENSQFRNNSAGGDIGGGAIFTDGANPMGPGTTVGGNIIIRGSWFEGNRAQGEGGALFLYGYGPDKILLENSTVIGNTATLSASGVARGGGLRGNSEMTIRNVTFANNTAAKQGGGIWIDSKLPVKIANSTFSGNKAVNDAGGAMFLNTPRTTPVSITNSTIANNSAGRASGAIWIGGASNPITLTNSIVSNNTASDPTQQQVGYRPRNGGGNIEFPSYTRGGGVVSGSRIVDPRLGSLQKINGVLVFPLLSGSPAINTGVRTAIVPTTDERGFQRDSLVDVGAFEVSAIAPTAATTRTAALTTSDPLNSSASPRIMMGLNTQPSTIVDSHPLQSDPLTQRSIGFPQGIR